MVALRPLEEQRQITAWHDRKLLPGQPWDGVIREELDHLDLVLLLVGPDFIASPYCRDVEVRRAVERAETGDAVLIPIIVERCDWQKESFAAFQSLPLDGSALSEARDVEAALVDCRESTAAFSSVGVSLLKDMTVGVRNEPQHFCCLLRHGETRPVCWPLSPKHDSHDGAGQAS